MPDLPPDEASPFVEADLPDLETTEYQVLIDRATAYNASGDTTRLLSTLQELRDLSPEAPVPNRELGRAYVRANEDQLGIYYLEKARLLEPDDPYTLEALSLAYYRIEELDKARDAALRYMAMKPENTFMKALLEKLEREREVQTGFLLERGEHFDLFYDSEEFRHLGRPILKLLDDAYRTVGRELNLYPQRQVSVILYSSGSFREATLTPDWSGGLYDGKIRLPVRDMDTADARLAGVIAHEYVHAVIHGVSPACPTWLNEGLAMHFEGRTLPPIRVTADLQLLEGSFLAMNAEQARAAYLVSLSAVSFLVREFGMYRVSTLIQHLGDSSKFREAFDREMPVGYDEFVRRWNES